MPNDYSFEIGKKYPIHIPNSSIEWLDAAKAAEKYVNIYQINDKDGIYWKDNNSLDLGYADGVTGILYFYMAMYRATNDLQYYKTIHEAGNYILAHIDDYIFNHLDKESKQSGNSRLEGFECAIGNVLIAIYDFTKDASYARAAQRLAEYYIRRAQKRTKGICWTGNTAWAKDGNIVLFLINTAQKFKNEKIYQAAVSAGEQYLSEGDCQDNGQIIFDGKLGGIAVFEGITFNQNYNMPNWEFGAAGSGYILLSLYGLTGDVRYLKAAEDQAHYLRSVAVPQTKGVLIPRTLDPAEKDVFYLGHCHGIAGTGKFLYALYQQTSKKEYLDFIADLADGMEAIGAPEKQSKGLWNIETLCCGHAGIVHFFLGLYLSQGDLRWLDLARRAGYVLLGTKESLSSGAADWPIAFWRVKPDEITRPYSLFRGAAGIGMVLAELYMEENGHYKFDRLVDDPFTKEWKSTSSTAINETE